MVWNGYDEGLNVTEQEGNPVNGHIEGLNVTKLEGKSGKR